MSRHRTCRAWRDVRDQGGVGRCAAAFPQLEAVHAIVCDKVNGVADLRERSGHRASATLVNILDALGACRGSVGAPQFNACSSIVGGEQHLIVQSCEKNRIGTAEAGPDILQWVRARCLAVGHPELKATAGAVCPEYEFTIERYEPRRR